MPDAPEIGDRRENCGRHPLQPLGPGAGLSGHLPQTRGTGRRMQCMAYKVMIDIIIRHWGRQDHEIG